MWGCPYTYAALEGDFSGSATEYDSTIGLKECIPLELEIHQHNMHNNATGLFNFRAENKATTGTWLVGSWAGYYSCFDYWYTKLLVYQKKSQKLLGYQIIIGIPKWKMIYYFLEWYYIITF